MREKEHANVLSGVGVADKAWLVADFVEGDDG